MRLLNVRTLQLEDFVPKHVPEYAVLSHTWAKEEVLYQDILTGAGEAKLGWSKIKQCCHRAQDDGFEYVWIDTCCIDKTNSVELSMAINSMFSWYEQAAICYAYLSDVDTTAYSLQRQLERSRWFSRGWTLQELLAPKFVIFVGQAWEEFGTRSSLSHLLESITKITAQHLVDFKHCSIATKMSWAASRSTTLLEDEAYCLLGLFGIHLSPIYGEGKNALIRLQQELLKTYSDESVLAWNAYASSGRLLAASPSAFHQELVHLKFDPDRPESFLTNKGLIMSPLLYQARGDDDALLDRFLVPLNCGLPDGSAAVALELKPTGGDTFQRVGSEKMKLFPMRVGWQPTGWTHLGRRRICIEHKNDVSWLRFDNRSYLIAFKYPQELQLHFVKSVSSVHDCRDKQPEDRESFWEDDFKPMAFGRFIVARFEFHANKITSVFGVAVRRCDNTLTLQALADETTTGSFTDFIASHRGEMPAPRSRTDFAELTCSNGTTLYLHLRPCGWPVARTKLSGGARAFTVTISIPKPGDIVQRNRQESKTWQRLIEAVDELTGDPAEL